MKRLVRSSHFAVPIMLGALFWLTAMVMPNRIVLLLTNSLVLVGSIAVCVFYTPSAIKLVRTRPEDPVIHLVLGICYAWGFSAIWRLWSLLWLTSGQEEWMVNNDLIGFLQAGVFLGACYHLTSPGAIRPDIPALRWLIPAVVIGGAVGLCACLAAYNLDSRPLVQWLKPYIPR